MTTLSSLVRITIVAINPQIGILGAKKIPIEVQKNQGTAATFRHEWKVLTSVIVFAKSCKHIYEIEFEQNSWNLVENRHKKHTNFWRKLCQKNYSHQHNHTFSGQDYRQNWVFAYKKIMPTLIGHLQLSNEERELFSLPLDMGELKTPRPTNQS